MTIDTSRNRYCGPYAVAHILGLETTAEASALIREVSGRKQIQSATIAQVMAAIQKGGRYAVKRQTYLRKDRPTLAAWLKGRRGGLYVVAVTGHFVVVDGHRIYDNTYPGGFRRKEWPHRRKRVCGWWRFR